MAEAKTKQTEASVAEFLNKVADEQVRKDCNAISRLMKKVTGEPAKMWGPSIVGFGKYHYKYDSGHEGDSCLTGFAPRKGNIALYLMSMGEQETLLKKLGKYKGTKGCLYIKKLEDVDTAVLEKLIEASVKYVKKKYPSK